MTKKEKAYAWMDKQIEACNIKNMPLDPKDPYFVCVAGGNDNDIHVYNIDNLCNIINVKYEFEPHDFEYNRHYFMYKGYKFFGLVERKNDERK